MASAADRCPCGALVLVSSVRPDLVGWEATCYGGHKLFLADLASAPKFIEEVPDAR